MKRPFFTIDVLITALGLFGLQAVSLAIFGRASDLANPAMILELLYFVLAVWLARNRESCLAPAFQIFLVFGVVVWGVIGSSLDLGSQTTRDGLLRNTEIFLAACYVLVSRPVGRVGVIDIPAHQWFLLHVLFIGATAPHPSPLWVFVPMCFAAAFLDVSNWRVGLMPAMIFLTFSRRFVSALTEDHAQWLTVGAGTVTLYLTLGFLAERRLRLDAAKRSGAPL